MRNLVLLSGLFIILFFSSCKKDNHGELELTGRVVTNGTNDAVRISTNIGNPNVDVYLINMISYQERIIASTKADNNGYFSLNVNLFDLITDRERRSYEDGHTKFYYAVSNLDTTFYYRYQHWYGRFLNFELNKLNVGDKKDLLIGVDAKSYTRFRLINTSTSVDSLDDILRVDPGCLYWRNGLPNQYKSDYFYGKVDTLLSTVPIRDTWSGEIQHATPGCGETGHFIKGKLTRHRSVSDFLVTYNVPPFDTTTIIIEY